MNKCKEQLKPFEIDTVWGEKYVKEKCKVEQEGAAVAPPTDMTS